MRKNVFRKIKEVKEVVNCFLANADVEGDNVVLVNRDNQDDVKVLDLGFKYYWSHNNGLAIHIVDKENKIDIQVDNVEEDSDDFNTIYTSDYMLTVL